MASKSFVFRFDDMEVREREFTLVKAGKVLSVEPKAFRTLLFLLHNPQKVISKEELLSAVWSDAAVADGAITRCIWLLRRTLGDDINEPRYIATVATVGYRFVCDVEVSEDCANILSARNNPNGFSWNGLAESSPGSPVAEGTSAISPPNERDAVGEEARIKMPQRSDRLSRRSLRLTLAVCAGGLLLFGVFVYLRALSGLNVGHYRVTPLAAAVGSSGAWSPDGKSIAYTAKVNRAYQLFLRVLNSPVSIQLTHEPQDVSLDGFSSDGTHVFIATAPDSRNPDHLQVYSVATVGGEPDVIRDRESCESSSLSPDGKAFVSFKKGKNGLFGVEVSDPVSSPPRAYEPAPFATENYYNAPQLHFSPDGRKIILLFERSKGGDESWLLPYPAGSQAPRRLLQKMTRFCGTPGFSWMPDSRHFVVSFAEDQNSPPHLWMADTESGDLVPLTSEGSGEELPAVAPDGRSLVYVQVKFAADVVSLSLEDGSASTLISSGRAESMPSQSSNQGKSVWVSNRNGPIEIWVRGPDGAERPAVTAADFPAGTLNWMLAPAISPDGERVIYERNDSQGIGRLWISSLAGGNPLRLTHVESKVEENGSWSPDGGRFVYLQSTGDKKALMLVRTNGSAAPTLLRDSVDGNIPDWSPAGNWITFHNQGWHVISPDGKSEKFLGKLQTDDLASSKDGKLLYGILTATPDPDHATLFSIDPVTLRQKTIKELGRELVPAALFYPGIRFSLAPDGKSIVYSTTNDTTDLWMLQGLRPPTWFDKARIWIGK
jgi:Tol biopolymer transport system component/DNA-binding winged helix-turn-helix (wHTH) protein